MTRFTLSALVAALALAACGGGKPAPARPAPPPVAMPVTAAVQETKAEAAVEWSYTSVGKRDPFRSFLSDVETSPEAVASRCSTPLGKFEIEQLRLVAVVTGLDDPVAMVEAPNGVGYHLRRGACIGRNGGVISAVRTGEVLVSEWVVRADGTRDRTQTTLRLPKQAALNLEE